MAFPNSPTDGQVYNNYKYDSYIQAWSAPDYIKVPNDQVNNSYSFTFTGTTWRPTSPYRGIYLDGSSYGVSDNIYNFGGSFTQTFWVYLDQHNDTHNATLGFHFDRSDRVAGCRIYCNSQTFGVWFRTPDGSTVSDSSLTPPQIQKWYHIALSYDGSMVRFYIDGSLKMTMTGNIGSGDTTIYIGKYSEGSYYMYGALDDMYLFDRQLSLEEIVALKNIYSDNIYRRL